MFGVAVLRCEDPPFAITSFSIRLVREQDHAKWFGMDVKDFDHRRATEVDVIVIAFLDILDASCFI